MWPKIKTLPGREFLSPPCSSKNMSSELKLPPYFPRKPKECARPGDAFFKCFTEKSTKSNPDDAEAGIRGLHACAKEMEKYKYCMENTSSVKKKLDKIKYRVQEEYRS